MKNLLFFLPLVIYIAYVFYMLYKVFKNKESSTSTSFDLGNTNYTQRVIIFTILATMIGPGYSYGAINKFYDFGFFYTIFFLCAIFQFWLFGHYFAEKIRSIEIKAHTIGDVISFAYGKNAQLLTGLLTFIFSVAIVGVLGLGGGSVLSDLFKIDKQFAIFLIVLFVALYSFFGGISAVIRTDIVQLIFILSFLFIGLYCSLRLFYKGNSEVFFSNIWKPDITMDTSAIIGTAIAFFLGEAFLPVYSIRGIIAKNPEVAKKSFKKSAYFGLVWFILLTIIGISAHYITNSSTSSLQYLNVIRSVLIGNVGFLFIGIAFTGMISVVMSTLDSILNAGGVSFRRDILENIFIINENQKLGYTRISILLIAILGIFITLFKDDIVNLLLWAYTIWVPVIVFPTAYFLLKGKIRNKLSGLWGMISGLFGWVLFQFIIITPYPPILYGLFLNALVFVILENMRYVKIKNS